jgi:Skp family chaperone for outer membrane proteins
MLPSAASAQALPAAVIAVVDLDRVTQQCNACRTATAALKSQITNLQNREKTLATPLETEQKAIQTAIGALNGKEPDAALRNRVQAFETKRQQAAQEMTRQQQQIQRNQAYIQQQISAKLGPVYQQIMQRRGATVMLDRGATLAAASSVDVTADVVAGLNTALPTVQTTAPAQPQQPQGR